ncbi:MAG: hypothetical protein ACLR6J_13420 [Parabacteroides merdae]
MTTFLIISVKSDVENIKVLFLVQRQENVDGNKADIDWNAIDSQLDLCAASR